MEPAGLSLPSSVPSYAVLRRQVQGELVTGQREIEALKVRTYWRTGRLISLYLEAHPESRRRGGGVMEKLSRDLSIGATVFYRMHQFAEAFPDFAPGQNLSWTHYRELLAVPDAEKRRRLASQVAEKEWSVRRLRRETAKWKSLPVKSPGEAAAGRLEEPMRGSEGIRRVKDLERTGLSALRAVDLGFDIYRDFEAGADRLFKAGDIVRWNAEGRRWESGGSVEELYFYRADVERVVDGDTLLVHAGLGFGMRRRQYLRLRGLNTPPLEMKRGRQAQNWLAGLLKKEKQIEFKSRFTDRYDRYLSDVWIGEVYVNQGLLDRGLAERV